MFIYRTVYENRIITLHIISCFIVRLSYNVRYLNYYLRYKYNFKNHKFYDSMCIFRTMYEIRLITMNTSHKSHEDEKILVILSMNELGKLKKIFNKIQINDVC